MAVRSSLPWPDAGGCCTYEPSAVVCMGLGARTVFPAPVSPFDGCRHGVVAADPGGAAGFPVGGPGGDRAGSDCPDFGRDRPGCHGSSHSPGHPAAPRPHGGVCRCRTGGFWRGVSVGVPQCPGLTRPHRLHHGGGQRCHCPDCIFPLGCRRRHGRGGGWWAADGGGGLRPGRRAAGWWAAIAWFWWALAWAPFSVL